MSQKLPDVDDEGEEDAVDVDDEFADDGGEAEADDKTEDEEKDEEAAGRAFLPKVDTDGFGFGRNPAGRGGPEILKNESIQSWNKKHHFPIQTKSHSSKSKT